MGKCVRFSGDVFEEDVSPEGLIEVEETIFGGLGEVIITSPCCLKVSIWKRISSMLNHLAMGAHSLPQRVLFMTR